MGDGLGGLAGDGDVRDLGDGGEIDRDHRGAGAAIGKAMRLGIDRAQVRIDGPAETCGLRALDLETPDIADTFGEREDVLRRDIVAGQIGELQASGDIGAICLAVIARHGLQHRVELGRLDPAVECAIGDGIDCMEGSGAAVGLRAAVPAPEDLLLATCGAGFLIVAGAQGRIAQGRVLELGEDGLDKAHAEGDRPVHRDDEACSTDGAGCAAQVDDAGGQVDLAGGGIDGDVAIADQVAFLEDGVADPGEAVREPGLDFVQLAALQAVAGAEHQLCIAGGRIVEIVIAVKRHGWAS